ncbi:uncharacterized protein LOC114232521 [Eptesicus fuscus]|uniref:uncharacterized protein LOC114232521 n=1 Tax=Eptesicus fuscus TaxID=29078 RepID=UPI002403EAC3|nr:uncharacterized protein LOC114232521 [Eptesicus fuscus]
MPEAAAARGSSDAPEGAGGGGTALPFSLRSLGECHVTSVACALPAASPGSRRASARARVPLPLRSALPAPPPTPTFHPPAVHVAVTSEAPVETRECAHPPSRAAVPVGYLCCSVALPLAPPRCVVWRRLPPQGSAAEAQHWPFGHFLSPGLTASETAVADRPSHRRTLCVRGGWTLGRRDREKNKIRLTTQVDSQDLNEKELKELGQERLLPLQSPVPSGTMSSSHVGSSSPQTFTALGPRSLGFEDKRKKLPRRIAHKFLLKAFLK